jgi:hypothetical protein
MATTTINASANSGAISCASTTYLTARSGGGTLSSQVAADARIGQYFNTPNYSCYQHLHEFDLSSLAGATISVATLSVWWDPDDSLTDFTVEARAHDYGTFATSDFVAGADLASKTLLASISTSGQTVTQYYALTDVAMVANLTPGGTARIVLASDRQGSSTTPTAAEYIRAEFDTVTAHPPKLDITYEFVTTARPRSLSSLGSLRSLGR